MTRLTWLCWASAFAGVWQSVFPYSDLVGLGMSWQLSILVLQKLRPFDSPLLSVEALVETPAPFRPTVVGKGDSESEPLTLYLPTVV